MRAGGGPGLEESRGGVKFMARAMAPETTGVWEQRERCRRGLVHRIVNLCQSIGGPGLAD